MVAVKIQDIELTPENYDNPTQIRVKELNSPTFLNLYENIQAYFHIVHVETDLDFIGFELFKNIQTKTYFKYDNTFIIPIINDPVALLNPLQERCAYCQVNIQLTEQILTLKRTNTKLTEVLGEVGGLMEVVFSLFRILSSFLTDNLYEQSLVNHLFSFDIDKKLVKIKEKKKKKSDLSLDDKSVKIYNPPKFSSNIEGNDNFALNTKNVLNDEDLNRVTSNNNRLFSNRKLTIKRAKSKLRSKYSFSSNLSRFKFDETKNGENNLNNNIDINPRNLEGINYNNAKGSDIYNNRNIVNKVKISNWKICCCFLCARKFNNFQNLLLDEGMEIIMQKLDILYIFKKIVREEKMEKNFGLLDIEYDMTEEGKQKLYKMYNNGKSDIT